MRVGIPSLPGRVAVAALATAVALVLRLALWPVLGDTHPYLTFYPAVLVAGLLGGLLGGLTATALGAITAKYFLLEPYFSLRPLNPVDVSAQAAFLVSGTLMSLLAGFVLRARQGALDSAAESQRLLAQLDGLLNHAPAGFAFINDRLEVLRLNPYLAALSERAVGDLLGRPLGEVLPLAPVQVEGLVRQVFQSARPVLQHELSEPPGLAGSARSWALELYPIRSHDRPVAWVGMILFDISERKRLEQALRRHANELAEADRRKDLFLAMLAHELRNPLAPLRTAVDLLVLGQVSAETVSELSRLLERQLRHLTRIIDDLLDTAYIRQGHLKLHPEPVALADVVESAVQSVSSLIEERHHRLDVRLPATAVVLNADPVRLTQVLGNLLHNAVRYTEPGGQIGLVAEAGPDEVVLRVTDTGIGIRAEMLGQIFELFQRGDQLPGEVPAGLGLGLTLVRRLVEMHGGRVTATSPGPGLGSEFAVHLPASTARLPDVRTDAPKLGCPKDGLRVLVVDDNEDAAHSLALLLGIHGYEVQVSHDGPSALDKVRAWGPDIVILDIDLPGGMDGYEVARRLRRLDGAGRLRLVALTGLGQAEDRRRGVEAGFDGYLVKPAGVEDLAEMLGGAGAQESGVRSQKAEVTRPSDL